jgi:hypothetical protein
MELMKTLFCLALGLIVVPFGALADGDPYKFVPSSEITLSRGPCYGTCPVYDLSVKGNGDVVYKATPRDCPSQELKAKLSRAKLDRLFGSFKKAGYFDLKESPPTKKATDAERRRTPPRCIRPSASPGEPAKFPITSATTPGPKSWASWKTRLTRWSEPLNGLRRRESAPRARVRRGSREKER